MQEFPCRYLDEKFIFLKETHFYRNTEEGHLAYSYPPMPGLMADQFWGSLERKVS